MTVSSDSTLARQRAGGPGQFGTLLLKLSVRFVRLPPEQVDDAIDDSLRCACEYFGIHRSTLWQCQPEVPNQLQLTHLYQDPDHALIALNPDGAIIPQNGWTLLAPKAPPRRMAMDAQEYFPWISERIRHHQIVVLNTLGDLPPAATFDRQSLTEFGTRSCLAYPLEGGGRVLGVLSFAMTGEERTWTKDIVDNLHLISQCFAHALDRKASDVALRQSRERLSLAATAAGLALWTIEYGLQRTWTNDSAGEWCGLPAGNLTLPRFLAFVHPKDRTKVDEAFRLSAEAADVDVEYRLLTPDGTVRWLVSRGRPQFDHAGRAKRLMLVTMDTTARKEMEKENEEHLRATSCPKKLIEAEVAGLGDQVAARSGKGEILGASDAIQSVHRQIRQVASIDTTVLILGETGTGKNLAAEAIHAQSQRRHRPMITVSCAALPPNLIEAEFFGHDRGAFTGAVRARRGRFELADGATIFLDEVGELPLVLQAKLLRVVQTGEFERLGSSTSIKVDVRIIAATNWDLGKAVREGRFRADLYYRLNVFPITMPPLRAHKEDIPLLTRVLVDQYARRCNKSITAIAPPVLKALQDYHWPGNVRELENVIERSLIAASDSILHLGDALIGCAVRDQPRSPEEGRALTLEHVEGQHIRRVLMGVGWRIEGPGGAAELLGLNPSTLRARMHKLHIWHEPD